MGHGNGTWKRGKKHASRSVLSSSGKTKASIIVHTRKEAANLTLSVGNHDIHFVLYYLGIHAFPPRGDVRGVFWLYEHYIHETTTTRQSQTVVWVAADLMTKRFIRSLPAVIQGTFEHLICILLRNYFNLDCVLNFTANK